MELGPADVEVDLYSGRPNPHVPLDSRHVADLLARVDGLTPLPDEPPGPEPLGYRGLRVRVGGTEATTTIAVFGGSVRLRRPDGSTRRLSDPGRRTEHWLVDVIAQRLADDQAEYVRGELGRS